MELTEKQLDTLKDFDLDMFKKGTKIIAYNFPYSTAEYVAEDACLVIARNNEGLLCSLYKDCLETYGLKMLPLIFVEDKPVYLGDVLYCKDTKESVLITLEDFSEGDEEYLTWNKPKVKKEGWVNLYKKSDGSVEAGAVFHTKGEAEFFGGGFTVLRIEWEE